MSEEKHHHILSNFDKAIAQTRDDISQMASLTKENLELAVSPVAEACCFVGPKCSKGCP